MEPSEDPIDYLERLHTVQYQFEDDIFERQFLKHFLCGCNSKYKPSILQIYRDNPSVTTSDLAEKLQIDFHLPEALDSSLMLDQDSIEHETVLAQVNTHRPPPRTFTPRVAADARERTCFLCGNKGHLMHECPLKNSGKEPVVSKCTFCNRYGHRTEFCWENERNAHRRPDGWTSIMPAKDPEDAGLVSFSLSAVDKEKNNEEVRLIDNEAELLSPLGTVPQEVTF